MRNLILPFLILICLALGFVFILINTPILVNMMLPKLINDHMADVKIQSFKCEQQKSRLPDVLTMKKVSMKIETGFRVIDVKASEIKIHNFLEFVRDHKLLRFSTRGLNVETKNISSRGGQLKAVVGLQNWDVSFVEGAAFTQELDVGPYSFDKITAHFKKDAKSIEVADIEGGFYGGQMRGQLNFDYDPHFTYTIWSEFNGAQSQKVKGLYPDFFSSIRGGLSGSARIVGGDKVDIFTIIFKGDDEVKIAPKAFLQMKGAFDETELAELKRLDESGAVLVAKQSSLHMQNSRSQRVMMLFDIIEAESGLVLKGKFPLEWDGDFKSFLFPLKDQ